VQFSFQPFWREYRPFAEMFLTVFVLLFMPFVKQKQDVRLVGNILFSIEINSFASQDVLY